VEIFFQKQAERSGAALTSKGIVEKFATKKSWGNFLLELKKR
jgi:hypothetical protein